LNRFIAVYTGLEMSQLVASQTGAMKAVTCSSLSSSTSSSSSFSASSSSSSSKVVKSSSTVQSSKVMSSSTSKTSSINVKSSGKSYSDYLAGDRGIDMSNEMDRLKLCFQDEMTNIHRDMFRLMPTTPPALSICGGGGLIAPSLTTSSALDSSSSSSLVASDLDAALVRLDADSLRSCIDKTHGDRVKLNFDVTEYESESIHVKAVGNKIEVHAQKKSKKGDEERNEEFSRVYELPTASIDPNNVTSSIFQDGVLTIELPVSDALDAVL